MKMKMNNLSSIYFLLIINLLFISSNSIFWMWILMEIMTFSFIFIILKYKNFWYSSILYFIIQSISSIIFIISIMILSLINSELKFLFKIMLNISLIMKMGISPFHWWYMKISNMINWNILFILMTILKIMPMNLFTLFPMNFMLNFSIFLSTFISSIYMIKSSNLKLFFALSSINNTSWMLILILINLNYWLFYFLIYSILNFFITKLFSKLSISSIKSILIKNLNFNDMMMISIFIISILGLPPLSSFTFKFFSIMLITKFNLLLLNYWIMIFSLFNIFSYFRLITLNLTFSKFKFNQFLSLNKNLIFNVNFIVMFTSLSMFILLFSLIYFN